MKPFSRTGRINAEPKSVSDLSCLLQVSFAFSVALSCFMGPAKIAAENRLSVTASFGTPTYRYNASGVDLSYLIPLRLLRLDEPATQILDFRTMEAAQQSQWTGRGQSWALSIQSESGPWRFYSGLDYTRWTESCSRHCTVSAEPLQRALLNNALNNLNVAFIINASGIDIIDTNQREQLQRRVFGFHAGAAYHFLNDSKFSPFLGVEVGPGLCEDDEPNNGTCDFLRAGLKAGFRIAISESFYLLPEFDYSRYLFHYSMGYKSSNLQYDGAGFRISTGYRW
ncbi:MAG: hypothetical protein KDK23_04960 [Leptospiraceae bacterium]|nr:hypothetical protein [Leptospiraceae bacterium]